MAPREQRKGRGAEALAGDHVSSIAPGVSTCPEVVAAASSSQVSRPLWMAISTVRALRPGVKGGPRCGRPVRISSTGPVETARGGRGHTE
jgi:hypothetical protein